MSNKTINSYNLDRSLLDLIFKKDSDALKKKLSELSEKEKGRAFEKVVATVLSYSGWIVEETKGSSDKGADLLLYHPDKADQVFTIVQCKNHNKKINKDSIIAELEKFKAEASKEYNCQYYQIISINGFVSSCYKYERFNITLKDWSYIEDLIKTMSDKPAKLPRIELRPHNNETYKKLKICLKQNNKAAVVQATGTGKSYILAKYVSENINQKGLLLAPSHYILDQFKQKFKALFQNVRLMTYSATMNLSIEDIKKLEIDFILLDEFHRCGAKSWGKGVDKIISTYSTKPVIGTTATPIRHLDGSRDMSEELFDSVVANTITLPEAIAREIVRAPQYISALYSIDNDVNDITEKIKESFVSEENKKEQLMKIEELQLNWRKSGGVEHILNKYIGTAKDKIVVFCNSIKQLKQMKISVAQWFLDGLDAEINSYVIHSKNPRSENNRILKEFESSKDSENYNILFSVDMLNEGLHIKDVKAVILLRETESPRIFFQQIGRCIDAGQSGQPIIFDFVNNCASIKAIDFKNEIDRAVKEENKTREKLGVDKSEINFEVSEYSRDFITVLNEIDFNICDWMANFELVKEFHKINNRFPKVEEKYKSSSIGLWCSRQRTKKKANTLSKAYQKKLDELEFIWDPTEEYNKEWMKHYNIFAEFKDLYKREPLRTEVFKEVEIGKWCVLQRQYRSTSRLTRNKVALLDELKFAWNRYLSEWYTNYEILKKHLEPLHENSILYSFPKKKSRLNEWCTAQRKLMKENKLSEEKVILLNEINFAWNPKKELWLCNYKKLKEFKLRQNKWPSKKSDNISEKKLGEWCVTARKSNKKGSLDKFQIDLLNKIHFEWNPNNKQFQNQFDKLKKFYLENKRWPNSNSANPEEKSLGSFCKNQRQDYKKGKMNTERVELFKDLGFQFSSIEEEWSEMYESLKSFYNKKKRWPMNKEVYKNKNLGSWCANQRFKKQKEQLKQDHLLLLNEIKFDWNPKESEWNRKYSILKEYISKYKAFPNQSVKYKETNIGRWPETLRKSRSKNTLPLEKIELLNKINFPWN